MGCGSSAQVAANPEPKEDDKGENAEEVVITDETSPVSVKVTDENATQEGGETIFHTR